MQVPFLVIAICAAVALAAGWSPAGQAPANEVKKLPRDGPLTLADGDTVVLLGDTFFERDYRYAHLETLLTAAHPGKAIRFRNLGWSGDTPRCESRSYFGPPQEGFERLQKQLAELKPSVVLFCYGAVDAFRGTAGRKDFIAACERLIGMIESTTGAALVIVAPPAVKSDGPLAGHKDALGATAVALRELAEARGLRFAGLTSAMEGISVQTENGVTFTGADYRAIAPAFMKSLGISMTEAALSAARNNPALTNSIIEKNRLFFHRWRPQNETYLFGFRKHEQGNNGVEIPRFDPLVAAKEKEIATLAAKAAP